MIRLPRIEDFRLMLCVARLQSNTDFQKFASWLLGDCEATIVSSMRDSLDDVDTHKNQGLLQGFQDLRELFDNSNKWSTEMQQLARTRPQEDRAGPV